jgi:hypothetical protein
MTVRVQILIIAPLLVCDKDTADVSSEAIVVDLISTLMLFTLFKWCLVILCVGIEVVLEVVIIIVVVLSVIVIGDEGELMLEG